MADDETCRTKDGHAQVASNAPVDECLIIRKKSGDVVLVKGDVAGNDLCARCPFERVREGGGLSSFPFQKASAWTVDFESSANRPTKAKCTSKAEARWRTTDRKKASPVTLAVPSTRERRRFSVSLGCDWIVILSMSSMRSEFRPDGKLSKNCAGPRKNREALLRRGPMGRPFSRWSSWNFRDRFPCTRRHFRSRKTFALTIEKK